MEEEQYLSERVDDQIGWYDHMSRQAQWRFKVLRGFEIIAAALIPLLAGFGDQLFIDELQVKFAIGLLGALILIASALISLNQYQENWIEYRTNCEALRQEKFLYQTGATPYDQDTPFLLLVQRVEGLLSREHGGWSQYVQANLERTIKPGKHRA